MASDQAQGDSTLADGPAELLVPLRGVAGKGGRPPLICMHPVSGSPYGYTGLAGLLPADQPVYGFQAPGFDNDRDPVASLPRLAGEYTAILRTFAPGQTYRLLGWSLGGLMAFEVAKQLRVAGEKVAALILVDAPLPRVLPLPPEREILLRFVNDMMGAAGQESAPNLRKLFEGWPEDIDSGQALPLIEKAEILPGEMDAIMLAEQYAVFRALLEGFNSIEVTGSFDGGALHILAEASPRRGMDWSGVLPGVREITLPGTHHSIWANRSLVAMSEIVRATLDAGESPGIVH